jgi:EAL domain-containing protein (putative c-di-GMP-specific phosphodiesterase class I)
LGRAPGKRTARRPFVLYYQPYLALGSNSAAGKHIEILLRLIDEDGKLVQPGAFLPAAERYNVMPDIDRWVIRSVFSRHAALSVQMDAPLTCAINLSGTTLNSEGVLEFIREQAEAYQLPPGSICFEITETADQRHAQCDSVHAGGQVARLLLCVGRLRREHEFAGLPENLAGRLSEDRRQLHSEHPARPD